MARDFADRFGPWAIVTGASAGIGAVFAERLAAKGMHVVLVARREQRLRALAERLQSQHDVEARVAAVDLGDPRFLDAIMEATADIEIGLLVNNAGYANSGPMLDVELKDEVAALRVNCEAPLALAHHFGRGMRERGRGGIIFLSSIAAFSPVPWWAVYGANKAFDLSLGEALGRELRGRGVSVLTVCPGPVRTEFWEVADAKPLLAVAPEKIVDAALKKLGRRSVVTVGVLNKLIYFFTRITPRAWMTAIFGAVVRRMQRNEKTD